MTATLMLTDLALMLSAGAVIVALIAHAYCLLQDRRHQARQGQQEPDNPRDGG